MFSTIIFFQFLNKSVWILQPKASLPVASSIEPTKNTFSSCLKGAKKSHGDMVSRGSMSKSSTNWFTSIRGTIGRSFGRGRGGLLLLFESLEVKVGEGSSKPMKGEVEEKKVYFCPKKVFAWYVSNKDDWNVVVRE